MAMSKVEAGNRTYTCHFSCHDTSGPATAAPLTPTRSKGKSNVPKIISILDGLSVKGARPLAASSPDSHYPGQRWTFIYVDPYQN